MAGGQNAVRVALDPEWVRDCLSAGDTPEQIAAWAGVPVSAVTRVTDAPAPRPPRPYRPRDRSSTRDAAIMDAYRRDLTLEEIGGSFGLTRERIRQITNRLIASGAPERRARRAEPTGKQREARLRSRGRHAGGAAPSVWDSRDPLLRAAAKAGFSASQVAAELGISRSSVLGRAHRIRVKFHGKSPKWSADRIEAAKRSWADPAVKARRVEATRAGLMRWALRQASESSGS